MIDQEKFTKFLRDKITEKEGEEKRYAGTNAYVGAMRAAAKAEVYSYILNLCMFPNENGTEWIVDEKQDKVNEEYKKKAEFIREKLTGREVFEGLAEEAAEVAQAALKVIRASGISGNRTVVEFSEASALLTEEIIDMMMYAELIYMDVQEVTGKGLKESKKWDRWIERLKDEHTV